MLNSHKSNLSVRIKEEGSTALSVSVQPLILVIRSFYCVESSGGHTKMMSSCLIHPRATIRLKTSLSQMNLGKSSPSSSPGLICSTLLSHKSLLTSIWFKMQNFAVLATIHSLHWHPFNFGNVFKFFLKNY